MVVAPVEVNVLASWA